MSKGASFNERLGDPYSNQKAESLEEGESS
jgi:hypothetical protein